MLKKVFLLLGLVVLTSTTALALLPGDKLVEPYVFDWQTFTLIVALVGLCIFLFVMKRKIGKRNTEIKKE
ncbi:MAG: hypothetical protein WCV85_00805 [Patescibacteria group bacterium]|jgi:hypothetical protein